MAGGTEVGWEGAPNMNFTCFIRVLLNLELAKGRFLLLLLLLAVWKRGVGISSYDFLF